VTASHQISPDEDDAAGDETRRSRPRPEELDNEERLQLPTLAVGCSTRAESAIVTATLTAVPDAPQPTKPPETDDGQLHGLGTWERWLAGAVGLAGVIAGGVGVFLSANQAGTTAILLLGAVFLLMAVQGTAIIKAGKDSVELERRRKKALDLSERAAEKLEQEDLPAAGAYQEAAKAVDPSIRREPAVRAVDEGIYTSAVMEAVLRNLERVEKPLKERGLQRTYILDMVPDMPGPGKYMTVTDEADESRSLTVVVRRRLNRPNSMSLTYADVLAIIEGLEGNILIVSEVEPAPNVRTKVKSILQGSRRNLEFAQWINPVDDDVLESKLREMLK
jgi:hypothetical protein